MCHLMSTEIKGRGPHKLKLRQASHCSLYLESFFYQFFYIFLSYIYTVFTRMSAQGAHLILSSQRGALIQGRHSFEGGGHLIFQRDIKIL